MSKDTHIQDKVLVEFNKRIRRGLEAMERTNKAREEVREMLKPIYEPITHLRGVF